MSIGQDISIAYPGHSGTAVRLYLLETFTFLPLTAEAAVELAPAENRGGDWRSRS